MAACECECYLRVQVDIARVNVVNDLIDSS